MPRLAFVGVDHPHGAHWRQMLQNVAAAAPLVALLPAFDGGTTSLEERYAGLPRFSSVGDLLRWNEFDAAVVCLPNCDGPEVIAELIRAGKHVLAEKPVGMTAANTQCVAQALEQHPQVAFQNGYMWRYDEAAERLQAMVRDERFGKLISIEMTFATSDIARRGPEHYLFDPAVSGGGFFSWLACHQLDLLLYITGQAVVGVTARTGVFSEQASAVEDGGVAILDLEGGGLATFIGGYWIPRWAGESHWRIRGSQRWVEWDPTRAGTGGVLDIHGPKPQWHAMEDSFTLPVDTVPGYGGRRCLALVQDWLDAMQNPGQRCRNTAQSTLQTLQLIDTIYQSSREGRRIECRIGG
ncbi:Glucose--fructose oxidoreductase precursor [Anatilimnocola aggregata]|uniref:Glucose--fructose oxidoreductase n=1 Tax=Anatilimnocola aggregata TaxID=2528021 RepID=A0A517Y5P9_9BACT|nr:Gfo/Idh/MocA family oxidoreductase [Anatilimnocola aggregata]QDU25561.1 Glucose--fructose oxidoreductase precursor [Anatilimnocola aggregata]